MPTFTAIALDRLLEPGAAKSMVEARNSPESKLERRCTTSNSIDAPTSMMERGSGIPPNPKMVRGVYVPSNTNLDRGVSLPPKTKLERGVSVPPNAKLESRVDIHPNTKLERGVSVPPNAKLERGVAIPSHANLDRKNSAPSTAAVDKEHHWTQISPALYATPESTPLPDSPSSFPPSPYIINHKRRGPRLMKSFSEYDVATWEKENDEVKLGDSEGSAEKGVLSVCKDDISVPTKVLDSAMDDNSIPSGSRDGEEKNLTGVCCTSKNGSSRSANGVVGQNGVTKSVNFNLHQDVCGEPVDPHPQDSVSLKSNSENEVNGGAQRSLNATTPITEFYDAWEELSSESGPQPQFPDIESELRDMRLNLLMEIETRKQAEENLNNLRSQWQRIHVQLSLVGLNLPADPTTLGEGDDPAAEVCQQVYLARFVSNSMGRGIAKAEVELEMEAQIELKNSEIARLWDRLHYFEAVNQEMSQRNQEIIETARRLRQRRKRRQRWIWGSISVALTLGSGVLAYTYLHSGEGSSSQTPSQASEADHGSK